MFLAAIGTPGAPEILLIIFVLVLLFGAKKLPELARGSGRALRIFKSETKGLIDDDHDDDVKHPSGSTSTQAQIGPPATFSQPQMQDPVGNDATTSAPSAQTLPPPAPSTERDR